MKSLKKTLLITCVFALLLTFNLIGQNSTEEYKPVYVVITTGHWSNNPDLDNSEWLKTEKEYFDKVTMKNDLIIGSGYYKHFFTPDNSEILFVSVYASWEDIENSNNISEKLIEEGWPNEEERNAFFEKQSSYYSPTHSDEIYISTQYSKPLKSNSKEPLFYYAKKNELGEGGEGFKEYFENVTLKNAFIKGYYTHRHLWGANSQDALEVFVFDSFCDIENSFKENTTLQNEHWPDETKRKAFFKEYNKIYAGHADYIYQNVPELAK